MNQEKITTFDLAESAGNLHCLAIALEKYVFDNVSSVSEITPDDLSGLSGLVKAMLRSSDIHSDIAARFDSER